MSPRAAPGHPAAPLVVLALVLAAATPSACFDPSYNCRILCDNTAGNGCPPGFNCTGGLCARQGVTACLMDGGTDSGGDGGTGDGATDQMSMPPEELCILPDQCLPLTHAMQEGLVLWLDPSTLPPVGSPVSVWHDRSGKRNDAQAGNPAALPRVAASPALGVTLMTGAAGAGLRVPHNRTLDVMVEDFAVFVVAGTSVETLPTGLFVKTDSVRPNPRQIALTWAFTGVSGAYEPRGAVNDTTIVPSGPVPRTGVRNFGLVRAGDSAELRVNGVTVGTATLGAPAEPTSNTNELFLGTLGAAGSAVDSLHAVVFLRGRIPASDLARLDSYLATVFQLQQ